MTVITKGSKLWHVQYTQNVLEVSERIGYDIAGKEAKNVTIKDGKVRCYVMIPLAGRGEIMRGPVTLRTDDVELVEYL